jgi:hypothetical protein
MAGSQRRKNFPDEYMRRFNNIHGRAIGGEAPKGGYPDMGNGRYTSDWSYKEWFIFNNWQRAHYNYLEQLTAVLVWIFVSCAYKPLAAAILGFAYFFGRFFYTAGYATSAERRLFGAIVLELGFLGLFILSVVTIFKWGQLA